MKTAGAKTRPIKTRTIAELKMLKKRLIMDVVKVNRLLALARRLP